MLSLLTITADAGYDKHGKRLVACTCRCGKEGVVRPFTLVNRGKVKSCGCLRKINAGRLNLRHGLSRTPEYKVWAWMISRCENRNAAPFGRYGGRGIRVCERWRRSFFDFISDMGRRPAPSLTLERADNSRGYEPGNCYWATRKQQNRNTRANHLLTLEGRSQPMAAWAEEIGIRQNTLLARLKRGWSVPRALRTPLVAQEVR